ncbi:MAG: glycosyltransferase family 1 protein [Spirochaetaceae bacterium]|nr:glycosyltransferase family 1 protein [Spirochaetaceae bacterium]
MKRRHGPSEAGFGVRIALIHYHLYRGGVTSVLSHQAAALEEAGDEVLVISGEGGEEFSFPRVNLEELRYDSRRELSAPSVEDASFLAEKILRVMEAHWGSPADVVHVHNPLIQKNSLLLPALHLLNQQGIKLLLQNHDLAEDFRPDVYIGQGDYPENCHYGVINSRDYSFLRRAGLSSEGLHLIPNEVVPLEVEPGWERDLYLYPVRAIRRKNLGEALLLSCFIPEGRTLAVTLPPTSGKDEGTYIHWKTLAKSLNLPVEFDAGVNGSFSALVSRSLSVITTSVKEGFGFSFLEPWTAFRSVMGRRLDYVCRDFETAGVSFNSLYDALSVPMVYLPEPVLKKKMEKALETTCRSFSLAVPPYLSKMLSDDIASRDSFDFGRLDEELQTGIIQTAAANRSARQDLIDINPFLAQFAHREEDGELIRYNREKILASYGREKIVSSLRETYRRVMETDVVHKLSRSVLLELYLDPLKLSLIGIGHD